MRPDSEFSTRWWYFIGALAFWMIIPLPIWVLGAGFAGEWQWLPDNFDALGIILTAAFYVPLAAMAFVLVDQARSSTRQTDNAQD